MPTDRADRFVWRASDLNLAQCCGCVRWRGERRCDAFLPAEIPAAIWENSADHRLPFEGDHGIRFAPTPSAVGHHPLGLDPVSGSGSATGRG